MELRIQNQARVKPVLLQHLKALTLRVSQRLCGRQVPGARAIKRAEVSLLLTDDKEIRKLNREWRGKDKPTDVLSFPTYSIQELRNLDTAFRSGALSDSWALGDIVISMPTLNRQRVEYGFSEKAELARLYIHGLVHLFGYDHELSLKEARRMQRVERYLLTPPGKLR